jgi:hypothetical protein
MLFENEPAMSVKTRTTTTAARHKRHSQQQQPQARQRSSTRDSSANRLNKSNVFHSSTTSLFQQDSNATSSIQGSGFSTLQLFKDIKNLQMKIQNDLDY